MTDLDPITAELKLERETCSRCGGTGRHSYCQMYGDRCFRCSGKGITFTKRGAAASEHLKQLRSRPAAELNPGDRVRTAHGWATVEAIEADICQYGGSVGPDGKPIVTPGDLVITTSLCRHMGVPSDRRFEVLLSRDEQLATLRAAIDYQATLTKAGKLRKAR